MPEPAQVVETCTGDPVYVMFKCEFTTDASTRTNLAPPLGVTQLTAILEN